jgi:hypothetical protein
MRRKRTFYDNPGVRKAAIQKEALRRKLSGETTTTVDKGEGV